MNHQIGNSFKKFLTFRSNISFLMKNIWKNIFVLMKSIILMQLLRQLEGCLCDIFRKLQAAVSFLFIYILPLLTCRKIYFTKITHLETETEQVIWCLLCSDHKNPFLSTLCDISLGIDLLQRPSRRWAHTLYTPCSVFH